MKSCINNETQSEIVSLAMDILGEVWNTVVETFHEISVHGFVFLVMRGNNILERVIWMFCISIGVYGIIVLGSDTWDRYQTNPTVISMDRSKFAWNTSFPSCEFFKN
jgi:hypothetical protein